MNTGISRRRPCAIELRAQAAVRRHAAGDADALRADTAAPRRTDRSSSVVDDDALKAGAESAISLSEGSASAPSPRAAGARTWRSTAVFSPLKLKSRSPVSCGALRSACVRRVVGKRDGPVVPARGEPVDDRTARDSPGQQLRDLVIRFARRIVSRAAEQLVLAGLPRRDTGWCARRTRPGRRPAAASRRAGAPATRCARRGDAPATSGRPARPRRAPSRTTTPTSSDPTRPGPCVTAIASRSRHATPASASARSTTPQMSRTCCRDASSGTTPPHSRWMATCDATTFDRMRQGGRRRRSLRRRPRPFRRTRSRCRG